MWNEKLKFNLQSTKFINIDRLLQTIQAITNNFINQWSIFQEIFTGEVVIISNLLLKFNLTSERLIFFENFW